MTAAEHDAPRTRQYLLARFWDVDRGGLFTVGEEGPELMSVQPGRIDVLSNPQSRHVLAGSGGGADAMATAAQAHANAAASLNEAALLLAAVTAGCGAAREAQQAAANAPTANVAGTWTGYAGTGGISAPITLTLTQTGTNLSGKFNAIATALK